MISYKIIVSGKVQGVSYRKTIQQKALKFGFQGFIKNLPNGNVEVGVMLDRRNYENFINILKIGSNYSKVTNLDIKKINEVFKGFIIRY